VLSRLWKNWRRSLQVVGPETVVRWHRQGFRRCRAWKSRRQSAPGRAADPRRPAEALVNGLAILAKYVDYDNRTRTHLSLAKGRTRASECAADDPGQVVAMPCVGGSITHTCGGRRERLLRACPSLGPRPVRHNRLSGGPANTARLQARAADDDLPTSPGAVESGDVIGTEPEDQPLANDLRLGVRQRHLEDPMAAVVAIRPGLFLIQHRTTSASQSPCQRPALMYADEDGESIGYPALWTPLLVNCRVHAECGTLLHFHQEPGARLRGARLGG
jgi:hypothetical protein